MRVAIVLHCTSAALRGIFSGRSYLKEAQNGQQAQIVPHLQGYLPRTDREDPISSANVEWCCAGP